MPDPASLRALLELDFARDPRVLGVVARLAGVAVFTVDRNLRFVGWSEGAERLTGYPGAAVKGERCEFLDGAQCRGFHGLAAMIQVGEPEELVSKECVIERADGREVTVLGSARLLRDGEGRVLGALGVLSDLGEALRRRGLAPAAEPPPSEGALVGASRAMREVFRRIGVAAASDVTTLITGESGTGKELCARAIHGASARAAKPFVAINCAALPESLLESELFGHARGAFTGADHERDGLFMAAHGGTLFLDEVAELAPATQAKLLRVLQERKVQRLGDTRERPIDVRLVAATHRDLGERLAQGLLRQDFYYRIHVFEIPIPPLRERPEDVAVMAEHFARDLAERHGKDFEGFTVDALEALVRHRWPGNGRELRNAVEHALVVARAPRIGLGDLPAHVQGEAGVTVGAGGGSLTPDQEAEKVRILDTLDAHDWNRTRTAEALGVSRVTLWKKMRRYRIDEGIFGKGTRRRP